MSIHVTPIPRLIDLAAPSFTLGTANAAGSAATAVASDSTLLAFDTSDPEPVAAAAAVGSSTTAARRSHVHAGTTATGTVVDEAITRFDGTGGASLQGYSSLSPTISDAGIISLTSGALKFPATEINSADANTLDDYQEGSWTPRLMDSDRDAGDENVNYGVRVARYVKIGKMVFCNFKIEISSLGDLTTSSITYIGGLPFTAQNTTNMESGGLLFYGANLNITAGYNITLEQTYNTDFMYVALWDVSTGISYCLLSEISADAHLFGVFNYMAA